LSDAVTGGYSMATAVGIAFLGLLLTVPVWLTIRLGAVGAVAALALNCLAGFAWARLPYLIVPGAELSPETTIFAVVVCSASVLYCFLVWLVVAVVRLLRRAQRDDPTTSPPGA